MPSPSPMTAGPDPLEKPPATSKARRLLKRAMTYLLVIYLSWLVIGCSIQRSLLFPSSLAGGAGTGAAPRGVEVMHIDIDPGRIEAWFIPGDGVSADSPGPLVIFAHGNAELIDHWPDGLRGYTQRGISVLLPEYRSYGRSDGDPSQHNLTQDFIAAYDLITQRPDVDPSRVILHGRSIGGAVVAQLASHRTSAAMILQSSPSSIKRMAARFLVPSFLVSDPFDSVKVIRAYQPPVLIMHGIADKTIPPSHAPRLANASKNPATKLIYYPVDHNTLPPDNPYWHDIEQFLKDAGVLE